MIRPLRRTRASWQEATSSPNPAPARLRFSGVNNTYSGGTYINGGLIQVGGVGSLGTGTVTFNNGGLSFGQPFNLSTSLTINSGTGTLNTTTANGTASGTIGGRAAWR